MAQVNGLGVERLANKLYQEDLEWYSSMALPWKTLDGARIAVSGATGMIGTFLIDVLMRLMEEDVMHATVYAVGRNKEKARGRLPYFDRSGFEFVEKDISGPNIDVGIAYDMCFHLASTTHPVAYSSEPVGTIDSNVFGLSNLLAFLDHEDGLKASEAHPDFVFASSVEIYGENRGDVSAFDETYCGYIDCNTLRAGYPESKRLGESMCQAYNAAGSARPVIPRLPRTYGPTMLWSDTKAISQFIKNGVQGEDIVLKSKGDQVYSYLYVGDVVSGMLWALFNGGVCEAYNIADEASDISLLDLAETIARASRTSVVHRPPSDLEAKGFSKATRAVMDAGKLKGLGWTTRYDMHEGIVRTLEILKCGKA